MTREAERAVIGSMLLSQDAAEDVAGILTSADFSEWQHADIFSAIVALNAAGKPADVITVTDRLIEQGDLEKIGGASLLHELTSEVTTARAATWHARIVLDAARRRRIRQAAQSVLDADPATPTEALAVSAREAFEDALSEISPSVSPLGLEFDDVMASLAEPPVYSPSPWLDLNARIDGFRPGALYVIGGRPGGGKSLMGLLAAASLAKHGPVAMMSLEMSRQEILLRLVSSKANVPLRALTRHAVAPAQWDAIRDARAKVAGLPLYVDDRSGTSMSDLRAHVRSVARRGALQGVVVDYLQLIQSSSDRPRWEVVGQITRELKALAREYNVPVLALSQLSRNAANPGQRPTLSDLRESGSIEQDADVVILLARVWDPGVEEYIDEIEAIVAKNRHGELAVVPLFWEGAYARIRDMSQFL